MNFKENFDQEIIVSEQENNDPVKETKEPIEVRLNPDIDPPKQSNNDWMIWAIVGLIIVGIMMYKNLKDNE